MADTSELSGSKLAFKHNCLEHIVGLSSSLWMDQFCRSCVFSCLEWWLFTVHVLEILFSHCSCTQN